MSTSMIIINVISAIVLLYWIISDIVKRRKMEKAQQEQVAKAPERVEASEDPRGGDDKCL